MVEFLKFSAVEKLLFGYTPLAGFDVYPTKADRFSYKQKPPIDQSKKPLMFAILLFK